MKNNFRTDLALEVVENMGKELPDGVIQSKKEIGKLNINIVEIKNENAEKLMEKPRGKYITITTKPIYKADILEDKDIENIAELIQELLPGEGTVLVVGLGNNDITPDAVGPMAAHGILATKHINGEDIGLNKLRKVAVISPGVLGQTGIESSEIIKAVAQNIAPCAVIAIDALAARSADRLGSTIQISNTGISPGAGVKNKRMELSRKTLGFPVISLGIPTVVDAKTLAVDLVQAQEVKREEIEKIFSPHGGNMMITPREIDVLISHSANIIAKAVNKALHKNISLEDINYLMN